MKKFIPMAALVALPSVAQACAICGLNESFSPRMLAISLGFVILPLGFVLVIGWLIWRDDKKRKS